MRTLTCEQVPEVVWLQCFNLTPAGRLSMSDFIARNKSILSTWWWRQPADFDALEKKRYYCWVLFFLNEIIEIRHIK